MDSAGGTSNVSTDQFGTTPDVAQHYNPRAAISRYHTGTDLDVALGAADIVRNAFARSKGANISHSEVLGNAGAIASSGSF